MDMWLDTGSCSREREQLSASASTKDMEVQSQTSTRDSKGTKSIGKSNNNMFGDEAIRSSGKGTESEQLSTNANDATKVTKRFQKARSQDKQWRRLLARNHCSRRSSTRLEDVA